MCRVCLKLDQIKDFSVTLLQTIENGRPTAENALLVSHCTHLLALNCFTKVGPIPKQNANPIISRDWGTVSKAGGSL